MSEKVLINVVDTHSDAESSYSSELTTVGVLEYDESRYTLRYEEPQEDGAPSKTVLCCEQGGKITVTRTGENTTQMIIEREKRHTCHYITPFGEMVMGIFARRIDSEMTPCGGRLDFSYTIDVNADFASFNELKITVSPARGQE